MKRFGKQSAAAARAQERREREDGARRLSAEVPELVSLQFSMEERSESTSVSQPKYTRHIMVATAPALFLVPCGDRNCVDGGHDVTHQVMRALQSHKTEFEGTDTCSGSLGSSTCSRVLYYSAVAEYRN
jgi:hypothetical protein